MFTFGLYIMQVLRYYIWLLSALFFLTKTAKLTGADKSVIWGKRLNNVGIVTAVLVTGIGLYVLIGEIKNRDDNDFCHSPNFMA
jgi:hypothetical protein